MKNKIDTLRKKVLESQKSENKKVDYVLKWLKQRNKINKMKVQKVPINQLDHWSYKNNGNLFHKSGQFFSVEGVKVSNAIEREVSSWEQPILNQKHGGILAIVSRERESIVEFLLYARKEPGDKDLKLCPSFSATQSNINRAHGGKKTHLTDIILNNEKNYLGQTIHFEEGARFWKKPNKNLIVEIKLKDSLKIKNPDFIWLNLSQIKKLNFKNGILNPFVKTILFMI
jgi:oxidase EvaA